MTSVEGPAMNESWMGCMPRIAHTAAFAKDEEVRLATGSDEYPRGWSSDGT
jgi:hypothetical protein